MAKPMKTLELHYPMIQLLIIIKRPLGDWHLKLKYRYVDNTTVSEVIPPTCNSTSLLDFAVRGIHNYCIEHNVRLHPKNVRRWS